MEYFSTRAFFNSMNKVVSRIYSLPLFLFIMPIFLLGQCYFSNNLNAQNLISVPFTNGFVGVNSGNNSSTTSYYLSGPSG